MTEPDPTRDGDVPTTESKLVPPRDMITGGFSRNADLLSYILAGLVLGLAIDWFLGTSPLMVVLWTLAGVGVGFFRLWQGSAGLEEEGRKRGHGV